MACSPTQHRADAFVRAVEERQVPTDQPLLDALANYLSKTCQTKVHPSDFNPDRLDDHLAMKIIEVDTKGNKVATHQTVPDRRAYTSQLSSSVTAVKRFARSGTTEWPGESLPETVNLHGEGGPVGYPALVDEGIRVSERVFLDKQEAAHVHRAALIRLFRLQHPDRVQEVENGLGVSDFLKLSFRSIDPSGGWMDDLMNAVIWEILSDSGRREIRDAKTFQTTAEEVRTELFRIATDKLILLSAILKNRTVVLDLCHKVKGCRDNLRDIEEQMAFLFRPGFIRDERIWDNCPRYLKALAIRLERLNYSSVKDLEKMAEVRPFQTRFAEQLQRAKRPEMAFELWEFAWLIQEYRVALFAPEVKTSQKVSAKRLERFWQERANRRY